MPHFRIRTREGAPLYSGTFPTLRHCVETAAIKGISLDRASLRCANLSQANLDDLQMRNADLRNANLSGANLSESCLDGSDLRATSLQNTCLAFSSLHNCRFEDALFGATDISGAYLCGTRFSTLSSFTLNFTDCHDMRGALFITPDQALCPMSCPPIVLYGLPDSPIVFFDQHLRIGGHFLNEQNWLRSLKEKGLNQPDLSQNAFLSWKDSVESALFQLLQAIHFSKNRDSFLSKAPPCIHSASRLK